MKVREAKAGRNSRKTGPLKLQIRAEMSRSPSENGRNGFAAIHELYSSMIGGLVGINDVFTVGMAHLVESAPFGQIQDSWLPLSPRPRACVEL